VGRAVENDMEYSREPAIWEKRKMNVRKDHARSSSRQCMSLKIYVKHRKGQGDIMQAPVGCHTGSAVWRFA